MVKEPRPGTGADRAPEGQGHHGETAPSRPHALQVVIGRSKDQRWASGKLSERRGACATVGGELGC